MDTKVFPIAAGITSRDLLEKPHNMLNAIIIVIPPGLTRIGISEDSDCADFGSCGGDKSLGKIAEGILRPLS